MPEVKADTTETTPVVAVEAPVTETPSAKPVDLVSMMLPVDFITNGVVFPKGLNHVTPEVAEDLQARVTEHERIREFNMNPQDYTQKAAAGNFNAAGK